MGRPKNLEREKVEKKLGITKRQANNLIKAGITPDNIETIEGARLRKLNLEAGVLAEKLAILKRENIPAAKVRESALAAGAVLKTEIGALEINLPPLLEGLNAGEMRTIIASHINRLLKDTCERLDAIS